MTTAALATAREKPEFEANRRGEAARSEDFAVRRPVRSCKIVPTCNIVPIRNIVPDRNIASETLAASLRSDERGAVMVEYVILVALVAIGGSLGLVALGVAVASNFQFVRGILLSPIP